MEARPSSPVAHHRISTPRCVYTLVIDLFRTCAACIASILAVLAVSLKHLRVVEAAMASGDTGEDEYVARLLKQDALTASKKYDFVGMDAFKRCVVEASGPYHGVQSTGRIASCS